MDDLDDADLRELAFHRRVSKLKYSWRCAKASDVPGLIKQGLLLAPGTEIGYVMKDACRWEFDPEMTDSDFDAGYYKGLLEMLGVKQRLCSKDRCLLVNPNDISLAQEK